MVRVMMAVLAVALIVFQRDVEGKDALVAGRRGICNRPKKVGRCKAYVTRWAWSQRKGKCVKFEYGGCNGNRNNFESRRECERKCEPNYNKPIKIVDCEDPTDPSLCAFNKPIKIVDCEDPTDPSLCAFNTADFSKAAFTMEDFVLPNINKAEFDVKASFNKPRDPDGKDGSFLPTVSKDGLMPPPDFIDGSFKPDINKGDLMPSLLRGGSSKPAIDKEAFKPNVGAFVKVPNVEEEY